MATFSFYLPCTTKAPISAEYDNKVSTSDRRIRSPFPSWDGDSRRPSLSGTPSRVEFLISARHCANSSSWVGGLRNRKGGPVCSLREHDLHFSQLDATGDVLDEGSEDTLRQIAQQLTTIEDDLSLAEDGPEGALIAFDNVESVAKLETECTNTGSASGADEVSVQSAAGLFTRNNEERKVVRTAWEKLVRWSKSWQLLNARRKNALKKTKKVVVLGGGSFGTAMAVLLARNKAEMNVTLLLRDHKICQAINDHHMNLKYFPRHQLPKNVTATTDPKAALEDAQYCVHAIPVQSSTEFLHSIAEYVPATLPFLSVSKGLELSTLEMMSQVIPRALGNPRQPVAVISGPSFAIELMDELPTAMVAASRDKELARACQQLLASRYLRVNTSTDVVGVEMAGALKNVLAIAAGIVEGMKLGNNCMAALVAQGCSEIRWLAEKMGAKSHTLSGLSGSGDIMLTCFVNLSRNRSVGVRLGSGEKLEDILSSMNQVAEGVATAGAVISLAKKYRVQMPILTAVARILDNELTPKTAVLALMSLPQVEEHLCSGWHVDQAILAEERVVIIRFGYDGDTECMQMDEVLQSVAEQIKSFAVIYVVDIDKVPGFNLMYELDDPCTTMFFFRNKHIKVDLGTGNNYKINWALNKEEFIDIVVTVYTRCTERIRSGGFSMELFNQAQTLVITLP